MAKINYVKVIKSKVIIPESISEAKIKRKELTEDRLRAELDDRWRKKLAGEWARGNGNRIESVRFGL